MPSWTVWLRVPLSIAAFVAIAFGPAWLAAIGWVFVMVSLLWFVFAPSAPQFAAMQDANVLPPKLSIRTARITVVVLVAISGAFLVASW